MQLVAIAKLRKLRKVIESREYSLFLVLEMFAEINDLESTEMRSTFVIITSEKSCCGKINNDILSASKEAIATCLDENQLLNVISVGWKGRVSLSAKFKTALCKSVSDMRDVSFFFSYVISLCVLDTFFDKCVVYFSKFYKIFEQLAALYEFRSYNTFFHYAYSIRRNILFFDLLLSNCLLFVKSLYTYSVCLIVFDALTETKYSELGCRAFSMEMAHKNSIDLINLYMLVYNKARQAAITTDLLEVVAGAIYTV